MEREIQNTKQIWCKPQITEIEVKMTKEQHGHGHHFGKHGTSVDGLGTTDGHGHGHGHGHCS